MNEDHDWSREIKNVKKLQTKKIQYNFPEKYINKKIDLEFGSLNNNYSQNNYFRVSKMVSLDKNLLKKIKKAKKAIDAVIDLHGFSQEQAFKELVLFILKSYSNNLRNLLIITGKGKNSQEIGVLKRNLPMWLTNSEIADKVLGFDEAGVKHGGSGSFYVILHKKN